MRQQFLIFSGLIFLAVVLVGLNAATYVQKEKTPDTEMTPNRSTYNNGATGARVFYELLAETGRKPARWQEPVSALATNGKNTPSTFVIIGRTRREFTDREIEQLLNWVSHGKKLVIIDREPPGELIKTTAEWNISIVPAKSPPVFNIDPSDPNQMSEKTAAKPIQPTVFTAQVNHAQASKMASSINIERLVDEKVNVTRIEGAGASTAPPDDDETEPSPVADENAPVETIALRAPVVHLADGRKNLLVDFPFGDGQIVFLSDPYIVSNGGINLADNAQIAVNAVASGGGTVAFDEFHQGYGSNNNRFLEYFEGTPLVAFFVQFALIVGLIAAAQSVRFARPLPERAPDRLSKLEYVSAMAELQRRTGAFDLAIENIYTEFRRRTVKRLAAGNQAVSLDKLVGLIAERTGENSNNIKNLLFKCEEIVRGEPTGKKEVLRLTSRLREIEEKLGLQRQNRAGKIV